MRTIRRTWIAILLILGVAALFRAWLIDTGSIQLESDEAVIALMARHINQGNPLPILMYGQDYLGSLEPILCAIGFRVLGESVTTLRITMSILYGVALLSAYALALTLTHRRRVALIALLIMALPTMQAILHTSTALGPHVETSILTNLILLLGWQVTIERREETWRWAALGLAAGLGWWTYAAIITAVAAAGLMGLYTFSWRHRWRYLLVLVMFLIGSAPWWLYNVQHDWAAFNYLFEGYQPRPGETPPTKLEVFGGLVLLGTSTLYGLRHPWKSELVMTAGAVIAGIVYLLLFTDMLWFMRRRRPDAYTRPMRLIWLVVGLFTLIFMISSFFDSTGRYLMPLWGPLTIGLAIGLDRLRRGGWFATALPLGLLLAFQVGSAINTAAGDEKIQYQLIDTLITEPEQDEALLDFVAEQGYSRGYASYWASFRLIFRSHEALILDTDLPYYDGKYIKPGRNRYEPYTEMVAGADDVIWITHNFPALDEAIERRLGEAGITFQIRDFGRYRLYYDFSERAAPAEFGLDANTFTLSEDLAQE